MGGFAFYQVTWTPLYGILRARNWQPVECTILKSELERGRGSKGSSVYAIRVRYAYEFQGHRYESDRYGFTDHASNTGRARKQAVVNALRVGTAATCYVDPRNPAEAVISREPNSELWWGLFPLPFLAVGFFGFFYGPRLAAKGGNLQKRPVRSAGSTWRPSPSVVAPPAGDEGEVILKSAASPAAKLLGIVVLGLFWNGIVSIFVWDVIKGFQKGRPDWFLAIFMSIFVLIGIVLIGSAIYQFLSLFNPRITLTVDKGAVPLGKCLTVSWGFTGRTARIRNLRIVLEGLERATYTRGTDRVTTENVFAELPVVDAEGQSSIRSGNVTLTIPADLMHSFKSRNNAIIWRFKVRGEIARFPDVIDEFPIAIQPQKSAA